ncbi:MAG: UDP-N-acetylglucosamine diphosphorylase/glucosamine-1-phosphate N-acetyltransferase [Zetaproteobacteria bacterium CG1_02_49_23]|nr:MAG: UDP-N-acetylglucosamine diphosphorylase/glucosamine-1-phosphate N-acetyltransferase [Zetaproteobacteria bacterium CG1_02_49_23]
MIQNPNVHIIILAAGQGTRMKSSTPKVLHKILGKSMLGHVLHTVEGLRPQSLSVVVGHEAERIRSVIGDPANMNWVNQHEQLGTGHAVMQCKSVSVGADNVLIVCGDTPLLQSDTLHKLMQNHQQSSAVITMLTAKVVNPFGYGRVCRNTEGNVIGVVEHRDASLEQLSIDEVNAGIFCVKRVALFELLEQVSCDNDQNEYYLPDIIVHALARNMKVGTVCIENDDEILGINNRVQLAEIEQRLQKRIVQEWQLLGVTVQQPESVRIEATVKIGNDVELRAGTQLLGSTMIGDNCCIGPYSVIEDSWIDDAVEVFSFSHIQGAHVGSKSKVGPFARLRPEAELDEQVHVGNFVEIKKSIVGRGSKINHLSYIGDTQMGSDCNIGAGSITCNYDGANKHRTLIGDNVFVGSDTKMIAPVEIKSGATVGAGSIITKTVNENGLTLSARPEQRHVPGWQRPKKG